MGLRTASVRHPRGEVMAPALTETNQSAQSFKLPQDQFAASPTINGTKTTGTDLLFIETCKKEQQQQQKQLLDVAVSKDAFAVGEPVAFAADVLLKGGSESRTIASEHEMNCGSSMGDEPEDTKMGLQRSTELDLLGSDAATGSSSNPTANGSNSNSKDEDVADMFNLSVTESDMNNVDDIMQVFKSIGSGPNMFGSNVDNVDADLATTSLAEELFKDVMGMGVVVDEGAVAESKEVRARELLELVSGKQAMLERKLDRLLRTMRKFQVRHMGRHVSGEIAGVFEHVHRTLKRSKAVPPPSTARLPDDGALSSADTSVGGGGGGAVSVSALSSASSGVGVEVLNEKLRPLSYNSTKNLLKKLELSNAVSLANSSYKRQQQQQSKYGGGGGSSTALDCSTYRSPVGQVVTIPQWAPDEKKELQSVAGNLDAELRIVQDEVDSEATASSSGGESCDENESYNNPHQQFLPIHKRAAWKYAVDRSAIASKWSWLQSQISDLEYRIRQHTELHRKIRASKERVKLGGISPPPTSDDLIVASQPPLSPPNCLNGYRGQLPGAASSSVSIKNGESVAAVASSNDDGSSDCKATGDSLLQCARTRPLLGFRKRKLLQLTGLHVISKRAARPATVRCGCTPPDYSCALCTGRTDPTCPRDIPEYLSRNEMMALLDPAFHPVFSMREDASASVHMEAIMKTCEWQQRSSRSNLKSMKFVRGGAGGVEKTAGGVPQAEHRSRKIEHRKKYNRLIKPSTANALSAKIKNKYRGRKQMRTSGSGGGQVNRIKKRPRLSYSQGAGSDGADEEVEALGIGGSGAGSGGKYDSPNSSPVLAQAISGLQKRNRVDSYDIDNIIIPYSVASLTRVEKLEYKEILTPKWRIASDVIVNEEKNNGIVKNNAAITTATSQDVKQEEEEDLSDEAVLIRHEKSEQEERKKFLNYLKLPIGYGRSRANRRTDSRAESSGANTPDPMSPAPNMATTLPPITDHVTSETTTPLQAATPAGAPSWTPPLQQQQQQAVGNLTAEDNPTLPSISALRRRTMSQNNRQSTRDSREEVRCVTPEVEVTPYEKRVFPLSDEQYDKMVRNGGGDCQPQPQKDQLLLASKSKRGISSNASLNKHSFDEKEEEKEAFPHDSESTESAFGDEDPNDPEWNATEESKDMFGR